MWSFHWRAGSIRVLSWLCNHFVNDTAATVERPIKRPAEGEVSRAFDVLVDRAVWQRGHCRSNRWWDHFIAGRDRRVECTATIKICGATDVDGRARRRRRGNDRALRRRYHGILPTLWCVVDAVRIVVWVSGNRDRRRRRRKHGQRRADRETGAEPSARVIAAPVTVVVVPGVGAIDLQIAR